MYFGLPVIGADKGASQELIEDGINGFLFKSGNYESLASFISKLYEDRGLRKVFGEKGKEIINCRGKFDQNIGEQFYNILVKRFLH
jgi:glycosyltransferase involved in cell wall biosynthesis